MQNSSRGYSPFADASVGIELRRLDRSVPFAASYKGAPIVLMLDDSGQPVALAGRCPHAGAPMAQGRVIDGCLRCPWHHASFGLADGLPVAGPTAVPLQVYAARIEGSTVRVSLRPPRRPPSPQHAPRRVVVVGAGAAAHGALAELAAHNYRGQVQVLTQSERGLYDRTQLSKMGVSNGSAPAALSLPANLDVQLLPKHQVQALNIAGRRLGGQGPNGAFDLPFDACLWATGAHARRDTVPGAQGPGVLTLRGQADLAPILRTAVPGGRAYLIGGGFIGLEVAAALAARGVQPHVVLPSLPPFAHVIGQALGLWLQRLHQAAGVTFVAGAMVARIEPGMLHLDDGRRLATGSHPVIVGAGNCPNDQLAKQAGLQVQDGIMVGADMATHQPGIWAAGDVARTKAGPGGRSEHWSAAIWQGAAAARSMLGLPQRPEPYPLVWTRHYGRTLVMVGRVGHLRDWRLYGDLAAGQAAVGLWSDHGLSAVASVGVPATSLACAAALQRQRPNEAEGYLQALGRC